MKPQRKNTEDIYTGEGFIQSEQYLLTQPFEVSNESIRVPDLTSHSESTIVGHAVERLKRLGIPSDQIKFHIAQSHASFGEIVAQDPPPDTEMEPGQEIRLTVGTWAKGGRHRFSFFASDETLSTERSLDADQLEMWEQCKNTIVHLYADLDHKLKLDGDALLSFYARRMLFDQLVGDFKRLQKMSEHAALCDASNLIPDTQWAVLYHGLMTRSMQPFNLFGFKTLLCGYFNIEPSQIECHQNGANVSIQLISNGSNKDMLQIEWIKYLFCPLDINFEFDWKPPTEGPPHQVDLLHKEDLPHEKEPQPQIDPSADIKPSPNPVGNPGRERCLVLLSLIIALSICAYPIFKYSSTRTLITHPEIESIGGLSPIKAIRKGMANSSYVANGKEYQILSSREARDYRLSGMASIYGKERSGITVSGEMFDPEKFSAAHETLPIPCMVRLTNLENGEQVNIKINDRGPFHEGNIISVSKIAARELQFRREGIANVMVEVIY
jgi:rare lipoprotein A